MALAYPLHPIDNRSRNRRRNLWVGWCVSSWWPLLSSRSYVLIYNIYVYMLFYMSSVFFGLPIVSCSLMVLVQYQDGCDFWHFFKQHFDTRYLVFYNPSPPWMFLSLDLLSEYWIQRGAIGPLYVTSNYPTWMFCRGVSGFATDCPCDVWCRGLTTCLLHVGPPFGNRFLNTNWAVGLTYWILYLSFFVFWHMQLCLDTSYNFLVYLYFLNILYFFKYSCTYIFHRRSLCTFY